MELIKITEQNGEQVVSARELHQFLEIDTRFNDWILRMFEYGFEENIDFILLKKENNKVSKSNPINYALKLDMAKEIAMLQRSKKGKQARQYFIECEKKLKNKISIPNTYAEALFEAGRLALEVEKQSKTIEIMQPKADFFDQVAGSDTCFDMADVAKVCNLGVGRNTLFQFLRDNKILRENNTPYQQYIDCGYFRVIESKYNKPDGSVHISLKTVMYQKGIDFIIKRYVGRKLNVA